MTRTIVEGLEVHVAVSRNATGFVVSGGASDHLRVASPSSRHLTSIFDQYATTLDAQMYGIGNVALQIPWRLTDSLLPNSHISMAHALARRVTGLGNSQRRNTYESPDEIRGPIGLRIQHEPKHPLIEFVFVHGFPGGSRRTWSYGDDIATFWPKEWLPQEEGFSHVRIHTFGYDVDCPDRKADVGKINHFGKLLLDSIASNACFRKNDPNPIVFIAHSLGGLVVKKAINDAKQNQKYHELLRRFHTLYFLATPHQGLANAPVVLNILRACSPDGRNQQITDLEPNFAVLEEINNTFRLTYQGVRLHCFHETQPPPGGRSLVVDKNLATVPFADQDPTPLMTDHRGIPKFADMSDSDYVLVRDTLAITVDEIQGEWLDPDKILDQMRLLANSLGIFENEEDELSSLVEVPRSCEWLLQKDSFRRWQKLLDFGGRPEPNIVSRLTGLSMNATFRGSPQDPPRIFWLSGPPGSGKSHLSAYVIRQLQQLGSCSYYFLKHTDRSRQSLGGLLRSLAYQMASRDVALRRSLLSIKQEGGFNAEVNDIRTIWKQLFVQQIFRTGFKESQFWVIDALDEGIGGHELVKLFEGIPLKLPLNIFITSRHDSQTEKLLKGLPTVMESIYVEDTLNDIRLYLEDNRDALHVDPAGVETLIDELVHKSRGSFLWTRLVLQRLETVWNYKAIVKAMQEVPYDMNELYVRILEEMAHRPNKDLAKAILRWTITAARSLTTAELQDAIQHDIEDAVPVIDKMIGDVCGQLVVIERGGKVRLVHDTARDFLLKPTLNSEFAVDKMLAHGQVADVCLRYIMEGDVSSSQVLRRGNIASPTSVSALHEYAHLYFSEHVVKGPPADTDAISRVCDFLDSRVLHWVEYIARRKDLDCLTQTAKNLDAWVDCRSDQSPLSGEMKLVRGWAVDLIRLVTVFGKHILSDPSCIHTVIPQLSPSGTEIYRRFGAASGAMAVIGLSNRGWADRIFSAPFHDDFTTSTACSEQWYAVGLRSGTVVIYDSSTCQETVRLNHQAPVRHLEFSTLNNWILVSGSRHLSLWNYQSGDPIWSVQTPSEAMALGFFLEDSIIITATRSNHIVKHNVSDGSIFSETSWQVNVRASSHAPPPMRVVMSSELNLVGVIYRNQRLLILNLDNLTRPRVFGGHTTVTALAFNPALKMMAVGFLDGEVCVVNLSTLEKGPSIVVDAEHLVVSADGKTLLIGGKTGNLHIYDFEKLIELYSVRFDDEDIISMVFSPNGLQILDVRRKEFNVWAPSALYRRKDNEDSGSQGRTSYGTALTEQVQNYSSAESSIINAITCHHTGQYVFCGRADGSVSVCETQRGRNQGPIFTHDSMGITFMEWNANQEVLISCDTSTRIMVHRAHVVQSRTPTGVRPMWQVSKIFERRIESPIRQIVSSVEGEYLLVSDLYNDHIWTVNGDDASTHQCEHPEPTLTRSQKWTTHPRHKRRFYEIESYGVHVAKWSRDNTSPPTIKSIETRSSERIDFETRDSGVHFVKFGDNMWAAYDNSPFTRPIIWEAATASSAESSTEATLERFNLVAPEVQYLIGRVGNQLVFLNHDGWICTIRIHEQAHDRLHTRHFPVPHCWQSLSRHLVAAVAPNGDVVITKNDELAIVKRGLTS